MEKCPQQIDIPMVLESVVKDFEGPGFDKRIADAQAKIEAEVRNIIDVNIDPENLAKSLEERLAPLMKQVQEKTMQKVRIELDRMEKANRNNQGAGF